MEWPTWELQAHGSAAPAPDPAAPDDPAGSAGPGCPLPRLDPLGPWCSARLTFADGARVDVLVTVSDDHITVEDVRADPPLTLDGLADLGRWIEGPLDDAFRAATGQPRKTRPTPRQAGPADIAPERDGGPERGRGPQAGPPPEPGRGAAADPLRGSRPAAPQGPTRHARPTGGSAPTGEPESAPMAAGAEAAPGAEAAAASAAGAAERATRTTGEATGAGVAGAGASEAGPTGARGVTGLGQGEGVRHRTAPDSGIGHPADPSAAPSTDSPAEPSGEPSCEQPNEQSCEQSSGRPAPAEACVPAASSTSPAGSSTPPDAAESSPSSPSAPPAERARSAVLARTRAGERRKIAADAYRQAQREGRDPVLAVMHATGRNRRRSLRLIAGARDEGLLTPRHNKR